MSTHVYICIHMYIHVHTCLLLMEYNVMITPCNRIWESELRTCDVRQLFNFASCLCQLLSVMYTGFRSFGPAFARSCHSVLSPSHGRCSSFAWDFAHPLSLSPRPSLHSQWCAGRAGVGRCELRSECMHHANFAASSQNAPAGAGTSSDAVDPMG